MSARGRIEHINGVDLCVEARGADDAPAVLMIAGANSSMDWWPDGFLDAIVERGRRVVIYDFRDTGESTTCPPGEPDYTVHDLVLDVLGVLDALAIPVAHLVGLSMGGAMAQLAALHRPERVSGLTLMSTSSARPTDGDQLPGMTSDLAAFYGSAGEPDWADPDDIAEYLLRSSRALAGTGEFDEETETATVDRVLQRSRDIHASMVNHHAIDEGDRIAGDLADIAVPSVVIHGAVDPLFPLPHAEALTRQLRHAQLMVLDDLGHSVPTARWWDQVANSIATDRPE